jgi:hypothetical protein
LHGIGLLLLGKADSAHFPSDFNVPVVIFLLDYQIFIYFEKKNEVHV